MVIPRSSEAHFATSRNHLFIGGELDLNLVVSAKAQKFGDPRRQIGYCIKRVFVIFSWVQV